MSDEGAPSPTPINKTQEDLVFKLRTYLLDIKQKNRLDEGFELSDNNLRLALDLALDEYNTAPPFVERRTYANFPSLSIMILGGAIQALTMAAIMAERNYLPFTAGNVSTALPNRAPGYMAIISTIRPLYERAFAAIKLTANMEAGFGVISSPYGFIDAAWDYND